MSRRTKARFLLHHLAAGTRIRTVKPPPSVREKLSEPLKRVRSKCAVGMPRPNPSVLLCRA